jgi:histone-lysine N-methyltransferase SETD1
VLITGLNPLTTVDQISQFLRIHGRIREIDSKMDTRSGMQLGICWVKFDGPVKGKVGNGHDVAKMVVKACDGRRIGLSGEEKIKVVLDGRGIRAERAVKEEMFRKYPPPPPKKLVPPAPTPTAIAPTPVLHTGTPVNGSATPMVVPGLPKKVIPTGPAASIGVIPTVPKPLYASLPARPSVANAVNGAYRPTASNYETKPYASAPNRSFPPRGPALPSTLSRPAGLPIRPVTTVQNLSSSFVDAPFASSRYRNDDSRRRREHSYSRSYSSSYDSYSSESEDDRPTYRRRSRSPYARGRVKIEPSEGQLREEEEAIERATKAVEDNGHAYIFIDTGSLPAKSVEEDQLKDFFRTFRPIKVSILCCVWLTYRFLVIIKGGISYLRMTLRHCVPRSSITASSTPIGWYCRFAIRM